MAFAYTREVVATVDAFLEDVGNKIGERLYSTAYADGFA